MNPQRDTVPESKTDTAAFSSSKLVLELTFQRFIERLLARTCLTSTGQDSTTLKLNEPGAT